MRTPALTINVVADIMHQHLVPCGANKPGTVRNKCAKLRTLATKLGHGADVRPMFRDVPRLLAFLESEYSNRGTLLAMLTPVISAVDCVGMRRLGVSQEHYALLSDAMKTYTDERRGKREENPEPAYLKENRTLTYASLQGAADACTDEWDRIIVGLYTCIPPRRLEYASLKFCTDAKDSVGNCVHMFGEGPPELVLRDYKTSAAYGEVRIALEDTQLTPQAGKLGKILADSYEQNPRAYVFGCEVPHCTFSGWVRRAFAKATPWKGVTVQLLRRLFATHLAGGPPLSTNDKRALARMAGHSMEQSDTYKMIDRLQEMYEASQADQQDRGRMAEELAAILQELTDVLTENAELHRLLEKKCKYCSST